MADASGGGDRLDVEGIIEGPQTVPGADAATEHDRDLDEVHVVDKPGGEEIAYDGRAAARHLPFSKSRDTSHVSGHHSRSGPRGAQ